MLTRVLILLVVGAVGVWLESELFLMELEQWEDKKDLERKWILLKGGWW